jgi:hypothetical protein
VSNSNGKVVASALNVKHTEAEHAATEGRTLDEGQHEKFFGMGGNAPTAPLPTGPKFLKDMFADTAGDVQVCGFQGDPNVKVSGMWSSGPARDKFRDASMKPDVKGTLPNVYFVPYNFKPGETRSEDTFVNAVMIAVDDVGTATFVAAEKARWDNEGETYSLALAAWKAAGSKGTPPIKPEKRKAKIARETLLAMFGEPTFALVTSPGNEQFFYKLDTPCEDRAKVKALLRAIGSDAKDLARFMRLVGGSNQKAILGQPFVSVMGSTGYNPARTFNIDTMIAKVKADVAAVAAERHRAPDPNAPVSPYFLAIEKAGVLDGPANQGAATLRAWWFPCPAGNGSEAEGGWIGATEGHTPELCKVWETGGVQCWHDTCQADDVTGRPKRSAKDLIPWVEKHYPRELAEAKRELGIGFKPVDENGRELIPGVDYDADEEYLPEPPKTPEQRAAEIDAAIAAAAAGTSAVDEIARLEAAIAARPAVKLYPLGKDNPDRKLPSRQTANVLITRGEAAMLVAQGAGGKGALMLSMLMAMQTQRHDLFDPQSIAKFEGPVLLVSNEDTEDDLDRRRKGWLKIHDLDKGALVGPQAYMVPPNFRAFVLDERGRVAPTTELMVVLRDAKQMGASAVGLDTFLSVLGGGMDENDNSTMGAIGALMTHLSKRYNLCLFGLSHMPKGLDDEKARGNAASLRGGGAMKDAIRNMLTLTRVPRDKIADPADLGFVYVLEGAKSNHGGPRTMYFRLHLVEISTYDLGDEYERQQKVPVMVPYVMAEKRAADSDNAGIEVLDAILASEADDYTGEPMRVKGRGDVKSAARIIAEGSEDATEADTAATIRAFEAKGLLQQVAGKKSKNGGTPPVWATTPEGKTWLAAKQAVFAVADGDTSEEEE